MPYSRDDKGFTKSIWIEKKYSRQLRGVAREIGRIIGGHNSTTLSGLQVMQRALEQYAGILRPWAVKTAQQTAEQLDRQDRAMWIKQSREIGAGLRDLIDNQPAGGTLQDFLDRQVHYITSLPIEAGQRVQDLAREAMAGGRRPDEIANEIARSGEVTESRATLIARTECARTASLLTQVRAEGIGATHYIWRTSKDRAVRHSHKMMEGKVCELADPPTLSDGTTTNPGQIYNCFVGSTKISLRDGCKNLWRYWNEGTIVSVTVDSGEVFDCTPNHPILTSNGWRAANDLKEGDHLLTSMDNSVSAIDCNEAHFETTFDDLFCALSLSSSADSKSSGEVAFNFHGDIPTNDVDHISVDRKLLLNFAASRANQVGNLKFANADGSVVSIGDGGFPHSGKSGIPRLGNSESSLFRSHGLHADDVGFGTTPDIGSVESESLPDAFTSEAEPIGQRENAFPGNIGSTDFSDCGITSSNRLLLGKNMGRSVADFSEGMAERLFVTSEGDGGLRKSLSRVKKNYCTVKKITREFRSCHVYTLESYTGTYSVTPARIISKNCRCTMQVILPAI